MQTSEITHTMPGASPSPAQGLYLHSGSHSHFLPFLSIPDLEGKTNMPPLSCASGEPELSAAEFAQGYGSWYFCQLSLPCRKWPEPEALWTVGLLGSGTLAWTGPSYTRNVLWCTPHTRHQLCSHLTHHRTKVWNVPLVTSCWHSQSSGFSCEGCSVYIPVSLDPELLAEGIFSLV